MYRTFSAETGIVVLKHLAAVYSIMETNPTHLLTLPAFGEIEPDRIVSQDDLFVVIRDKYPVSPGHTLIIPRRPVVRFNKLTVAEATRLTALVASVQEQLNNTLSPKPDAYNIGVNDGEAAGQTIPQFHLHVIPRYRGDVTDPRGGVRWIIPEKAKYWE